MLVDTSARLADEPPTLVAKLVSLETEYQLFFGSRRSLIDWQGSLCARWRSIVPWRGSVAAAETSPFTGQASVPAARESRLGGRESRVEGRGAHDGTSQAAVYAGGSRLGGFTGGAAALPPGREACNRVSRSGAPKACTPVPPEGRSRRLHVTLTAGGLYGGSGRAPPGARGVQVRQPERSPEGV